MSTNLNYKQVTNVARRTWDVEAYEKRAQERLKQQEGGRTTDHRPRPATTATAEAPQQDEEFTPAAPTAAKAHRSERAFLKARNGKVEGLDSKIGSVEIVHPDAAAAVTTTIRSKPGSDTDTAVTKSGIGWHCKVCDCFLKDSHTYLDHINGRKHQRNLGYSMRVERSTKEQVSSKLAALVRQNEQTKKGLDFDDAGEEEESYHALVKAKDEELRRKKDERKKERKERRKKKKEQQKTESTSTSSSFAKDQEETEGDAGGDGEDEEEEGGIDPNLAAMMGFSGFGGGKK
jgi:U4/U6.U5 tri-snRNP component SNU23